MDWIETWIAVCAVFLAVCAGEAINTNARVKEILARLKKKTGNAENVDDDENVDTKTTKKTKKK